MDFLNILVTFGCVMSLAVSADILDSGHLIINPVITVHFPVILNHIPVITLWIPVIPEIFRPSVPGIRS